MHWKTLGAIAVALPIAAFAARQMLPSKPGPGTMPAEYVYLDSDRVLGYLGQLVGGLSDTEKRTSTESTSHSGTLKGGLAAEVSGSHQEQTSIEETVNPVASDRFYKLLQQLRSGTVMRNDRAFPWLQDMETMVSSQHDIDHRRADVDGLREGDFIRLQDAHLFLARYAGLAPRARYARQYVHGDLTSPGTPLKLSEPAQQGRDVDRYLKSLGADPVLPFVVPTLWRASGEPSPTAPVFVVPARYGALLDNARLVAGDLTVVGKVIYIGRRNVDRPDCATSDATSSCSYLDRQTVATFAPALARAEPSVLKLLHMERSRIASSVAASVRFDAPVVVILPVAIYQ